MDLVAQNIFFFALAAAMVFGAFRVVTSRNMIHAALWLVIVLAGVAGQFVLLLAEFTAVTQVLVYIGAIIVLLLFGVMLTRAPVGDTLEHDTRQVVMGVVVALPLLGLMAFSLWDTWEDTDIDLERAQASDINILDVVEPTSERAEVAAASNTVEVVNAFELKADLESHVDRIGRPRLIESTPLDESQFDLDARRHTRIQLETAIDEALVDGVDPNGLVAIVSMSNTTSVSDSIFSDYIVPFEAVSVLLLAALIGAVTLARKD